MYNSVNFDKCMHTSNIYPSIRSLIPFPSYPFSHQGNHCSDFCPFELILCDLTFQRKKTSIFFS